MKTNWDLVVKLALIIFGIFLIYQIARLLLGGSWSTEELIVALLVLSLTMTFQLAKKVESMSADMRNFKNSFKALATDFKSLSLSYNDHLGQYKKSPRQ
ncbi:MAG: hypothetical protein V1837_03330 [Candidatus Woesearchaeota archaeon]